MLMRMFFACVVAVSLAAWAPATFQDGAVDRAKRTLESGIQFYNSGDYKNAIQDFSTVINGYASSEWVDEAMLRMAIYHYEVEHDLAKARQMLEKILTEQAESNSAPDAYYYLGLFLSSGPVSAESVRDGLANYERVARLFPESDKADDALFRAGQINVAAGEFEPALAKFQRLLWDYPESNLQAEAQFAVGDCHYFMDNILQAMSEYQQVRNRYPEAPESERALDRLTLLYRLHFGVGKGRLFGRDTSFAFSNREALDNPEYLASAGGLEVFIADEGRSLIYRVDGTGKIVDRASANRPRMVKRNLDGTPVSVADRRFKGKEVMGLAVKEGTQSEPLVDIEAAAVSPRGSYYVYDAGKVNVFRFSPDGTLEQTIRGEVLREVRDLAVDSFGFLYVLDGRERRLVKINPEGRRVFAKGPTIGGTELREPVCLAIDEANNVYILDRRLKAVFILNRNGDPLATFNIGDTVREARAIAVDSTGAILVLDRRERAVLRFK